MTDTPDILSTLDRLAEKATERPWADIESRVFVNKPSYIYNSGERNSPDSAFIITLVNAYPQLAARLRAAEAVCAVVTSNVEASSQALHAWFRNLEVATAAWRKLRDGGSE